MTDHCSPEDESRLPLIPGSKNFTGNDFTLIEVQDSNELSCTVRVEASKKGIDGHEPVELSGLSWAVTADDIDDDDLDGKHSTLTSLISECDTTPNAALPPALAPALLPALLGYAWWI